MKAIAYQVIAIYKRLETIGKYMMGKDLNKEKERGQPVYS